MAKGHGNVAAIGSEKLNAKWNTNFKPSLQKGDMHPEVTVLKSNLQSYRFQTMGDWSTVPELTGNVSESFDEYTEQNLIKFQQMEGLEADGIYGQASRNKLATRIGKSVKGYVRLASPNGSYYINFNDTKEGLKKDADFKLDHSWVTIEAANVIDQLAKTYHAATNRILEINDCSLIDGEDTPEHETHQTGREIDIRNVGMSPKEEKKFLELCIENPGVKIVYFHNLYSMSSSKLKMDSKHKDHFHVETV